MEELVATKATAPASSVGSSHLFALLRTPLYASASYLWASAAGAAVAGFAFWALVARLYDADEVGLGSAALSIMTLLATFSHLGLGAGLIRFFPESGTQRPRLTNVVFTTSAAVGFVLAVAFLAGVPWWAPSLGFLREQPLYAVAFVVFVLAGTLSLVQMNAFMAIRKANYVLAQNVCVQLGRLALPALMAVSFGAFGIVVAGGAAGVLGAAIGFALLARTLPGYRPRLVVNPASVSRLFPFSLANYVADSLLLTPGLILPLLVVSLLGSAEGGYFYMAWFLGYLLTSVSAQLALSLFAEGSHDPGALRVLSRHAVIGGLAAAAVGALLLLFLADRVLLVFGRDYAAEGATLLRIVALAALPAAVVNVYLGALRVAKRVRELVAIAAVIAVATVALSAALMPVMGLTGAGLGQALGQGLGLAIVLVRLQGLVQGTMPQKMRRLLVSLAGRA